MTDNALRNAALITIGRESITLDTLAKLLQCDHGLSAHCPGCNRWRDLDLAQLVREGHGSRRLVRVQAQVQGVRHSGADTGAAASAPVGRRVAGREPPQMKTPQRTGRLRIDT